MFNSKSMIPEVYNALISCNFLSHFEPTSNKKCNIQGDYIGFRIHNEKDDENLINHIRYEWITDDKIVISDDLRKDITSKIFEIFQNAFGHGIKNSNRNIDVISCGSYSTENQTLSLCIVDFGCGIAKNVKKFLDNKNPDNDFNLEYCLNWALQEGNSTQTDSIDNEKMMARGLGLNLLKEFIHINQGSLDIYTNTCHAFIDQNGEYQVKTIEGNFPGTMVLIRVNCSKEYSYHYSSNSDDFFK